MLCRSNTALQLTKLTLHFTHLLLQYLEFGVTFAKLLLKLPLCLHSILFHLVEVVSRALQLMLQPFQLHGRCAVKLRAIPKAVQIVPHIVTAAGRRNECFCFGGVRHSNPFRSRICLRLRLAAIFLLLQRCARCVYVLGLSPALVGRSLHGVEFRVWSSEFEVQRSEFRVQSYTHQHSPSSPVPRVRWRDAPPRALQPSWLQRHWLFEQHCMPWRSLVLYLCHAASATQRVLLIRFPSQQPVPILNLLAAATGGYLPPPATMCAVRVCVGAVASSGWEISPRGRVQSLEFGVRSSAFRVQSSELHAPTQPFQPSTTSSMA